MVVVVCEDATCPQRDPFTGIEDGLDQKSIHVTVSYDGDVVEDGKVRMIRKSAVIGEPFQKRFASQYR
jgi:hypothetical protein